MSTIVSELDMRWVEALRKGGLEVILEDGWRTRGRPASTGRLGARGQLNHHTGSSGEGASANRWMFTRGRPDLGPPLCQGSVTRSGKVIVGAARRANHAGKAKASGPIPAGDGNFLYLGWEHQNNGTEGWSKPQYETMVKLNAITALYYGWSHEASRAHKETSVTGKWDPGALYMPRFRDDIRAEMNGMREPKMNDVQKGQVILAKAIAHADACHKELLEAIDHFDNAKKSRLVVWRQIAVIQSMRGAINAARLGLKTAAKIMPPK